MTRDTSVQAPSAPGASAATLDWLSSPPPGQLIAGAEREGRAAELVTVLDPGTGNQLASVVAASVDDVNDAVHAARSAADDGRWSELDADRREALLHALAQLLERDADLVTELEALDTGKPRVQAAEDVQEAISVLRYFAGWANKHQGAVVPAPRQLHAYTTPEPLGVCAAITPWNYPLPILTYKLAPALATGNTVVAKPSELAPLSVLHLARLAVEAGIPDGVLNVVTGAGSTGAALAGHPLIDKIAFTGSTATGKRVMESATRNVTRVSLELGGKSAHVVFADADLDAAVDAVMAGIWTNAGQVCIAGSRLLVEKSIEEEFLTELTKRTGALTLGHSLADEADLGPLISAAQRDKVLHSVQTASDEGGNVIVGGQTCDRDGFFVEPVIVAGVPATARIAHEEVFGPLLTVTSFGDEQEAVAIANGTSYGLAAGLWTTDVGRAHHVSRRLRAGTVWVNTYGLFHPTLPFGGTGGSGFGRELGSSAIDQYTESKTTVMDISARSRSAKVEVSND